MYDAIIVGAGCAGSALAMLLGKRGRKVLLVDRNKFPVENAPPATQFIHQRGMACLSRWGLRDEVAALSPPITEYSFTFASAQLTGTAPTVDGEQAAYAMYRADLDEMLRRAAVANGVEYRDGFRVDRVLKENGRAIGVNGATEDRKRFNEHARLVIGADGPASHVGTEVYAKEHTVQPAVQATAWTYWNDIGIEGLQIYINDQRGLYAFPTSNGVTVIGANWTFEKFRDEQVDLEANYHKLMRELAPELAQRASDTYRADEYLHRGATRNAMRPASGPGWALIGDAQHVKDPCTAQGVTDAFCNAELLVNTIEGNLENDADLDAALETFGKTSLENAMPHHELTLEMATLSPSEERLALYAALEGHDEDISSFIGTWTQATPPREFFSQTNIDKILQRAAT